MRNTLWLASLTVSLFVATAHASGATVKTIVGQGQPGPAVPTIPTGDARLNNPYGLVRGPDHALYICEVGNHVIRRVDTNGSTSIVVGTGKPGYAGDGGPATAARLNEPYEVRFDATGDMFIVEMKNHVVRRVRLSDRVISTIAGTGAAGFSGDGGPADQAQLRQPHSIQFGPDGRLYICDIGNHRVRVVNVASGIINTFSGTGRPGPTVDGGAFGRVDLNGPRALDFDRDGDLWLALREGNAVYEFNLKTGLVHHRAGTGKKGFSGNGGPAVQATLFGPKGLSVSPAGDVYLADTESHSIRMIDVRSGILRLVAGNGKPGDGPDGDASTCQLNRPHGIFVEADGTILVGDSEAHRIRAISSARTDGE